MTVNFTRGEDFAGHRDGVTIGDDVTTPVLWAISTSLAHTLNNLGDPENDEFTACDPKQCAPCDGIYRLHEVDQLSNFLRPYVRSGGAYWDWWTGDADTGTVNWDWVTRRTWPGAQDDSFDE